MSKCHYCGGDGFTAEHDPSDPHEFGCNQSCPVQVQCEYCQATGEVEDQPTDDKGNSWAKLSLS